MIRNHDRSGWFGASDTHIIMGNYDTKTFAAWWLTKLGVTKNSYKSKAMNAGTHYEHRILESMGITKMDRQIKIRRYRLRVNLDGESEIIHEVKTHISDEPILYPQYWEQAQVQGFASKKPVQIIFYRLTEEEYENFFLPIEEDRIKTTPILYDPQWIEEHYLPRLKYLARCLRRKITPSNDGLRRWLNAHSK